MATIPSIESVLLAIHQSLGGKFSPNNKKVNFTTGRMELSHHQEKLDEILDAIFTSLNIDADSRSTLLGSLMELAKFNKAVELDTWTFNADQRQILWRVLACIYVPGIARTAANWNLDGNLNREMPIGQYWYLPEEREVNGETSLILPVAQVVNWLLDLLGKPLDAFVSERSQSVGDDQDLMSETLIRSLYNWRNKTVPDPKSIRDYFPDEMQVTFAGTLQLNSNLPLDERFASAMDFVSKKGLTPGKLCQEIPMAEHDLEAVLGGRASNDLTKTFLSQLTARYAIPSTRLIRQRLLFARMIQEGYIRLLKLLCPGVDPTCADGKRNTLLQLKGIYHQIYQLTIQAWKQCHTQGQHAEDVWFERQLPEAYKESLYLAILPSRRLTSAVELAQFLTRCFYTARADDPLEELFGLDDESTARVMQRHAEEEKTLDENAAAERRLLERLRISSPWRALQGEHRYWVVRELAERSDLSPKIRQLIIERMYALADTPELACGTILVDLDRYLNGDRNNLPKNTGDVVEGLLHDAETSPGYRLWEAPLLHYKAKHLLSCNDFENARKLFRNALNAAGHRGYGRLKGEVARDCLAIEVANQKLVPNNHQRYYRDMLAGGMVQGKDIPGIEDTARWASDYFWETLYKPYTGNEALKPRAETTSEQISKILSDFIQQGDQDGLLGWIKDNRKIMESSLPDVRGDSVLMLLIKLYRHTHSFLGFLRGSLPDNEETRAGHQRAQHSLKNWRESLSLIAAQAPKQLNIPDFKGQTPLMLVTEDGDCQLVTAFLKAGADPNLQNYQGMTALHSAIKSGVDCCVDALLDHPCATDKHTLDGRTVLHTACWTANFHAAERLIRMAPQLVWSKDNNDLTPLELAETLYENDEARQFHAQFFNGDGRAYPEKQQFLQMRKLLEKAIS